MVKPFSADFCKKPCRPGLPSEGLRTVEPMFETKKTSITHQVADAVDLAIDFATLGEYGLEPVQPTALPCEGRVRSGSRRSTGAWHSAIARFATQA